MYKYIIAFPIDEEPYLKTLRDLIDKVAKETGLPPIYEKMVPHITFHRPIENIDEEKIKNITKGAVLHIKQTRITVSSIYNFGKNYIVLPVHSTKTVASLWININSILSQLPEYEHDKYDGDNTLHISIAEKTSEVFDKCWKNIKNIEFEEMNIPVKKISIFRKNLSGGAWEILDEYEIPEK